MPNDKTIRVDLVKTFRLLAPESEPNFVILRIETQDGMTHNFGTDRPGFAHTVKVWNFDLNAVATAIEAGAPLPGKIFGTADKKAS